MGRLVQFDVGLVGALEQLRDASTKNLTEQPGKQLLLGRHCVRNSKKNMEGSQKLGALFGSPHIQDQWFLAL